MWRWLILVTIHLIMPAIGLRAAFIRCRPSQRFKRRTQQRIESTATETLYAGRLVRRLKGSDLSHWGEGEVRISRYRIAHIGRLALGPDYKLYLAPRFVDTKEAFLLIKDKSIYMGDAKTFNSFIVAVPASIDVSDYDAVVVWCEASDQFISAAKYQLSRQARK